MQRPSLPDAGTGDCLMSQIVQLTRSVRLWDALLREVDGSRERAAMLFDSSMDQLLIDGCKESVRSMRIAELCRKAEAHEMRRHWRAYQQHRADINEEDRHDEDLIAEQQSVYFGGLGL
jgi:hypothetical protein